MKIGFQTSITNPVFPANRMLREEQHMQCADDLHARILYLEDKGKPFVHVSIDCVEIYRDVRDEIKVMLERVWQKEINLVVSATHSHNCPCMTSDKRYQSYVISRIQEAGEQLQLQEYEYLSYCYQYEYFDQVGNSRVPCQSSDQIFAETLSFYCENKRLGTILIHNVHPTIRKLWEGDFTAEYPGYVIAMLKECYPDEFFTFMLGPAGDISPRFVRKANDEMEMKRLSHKLFLEYQRQLQADVTPIQISQIAYEEVELAIKRVVRTPENTPLPKDMSEEEVTIIKKIKHGSKRKEEPLVYSHSFSHLVLSDTYSMIFEPFELYSGFYHAVDKPHCSLITISNGFDHYVTDLRPQRVARELFADTVSDQTKQEMVTMFQNWSIQHNSRGGIKHDFTIKMR